MDMSKSGSVLQRAWHRFVSSTEELESDDLQTAVREAGAVPIKTCTDRQLVHLTGTLTTVTIRPREGHPTLEVELRDGSGTVTLVWLGRRRIPGIDPGRAVKIAGRISCQDGRKVIYNPRYELLCTASQTE